MLILCSFEPFPLLSSLILESQNSFFVHKNDFKCFKILKFEKV